MARSLEQRRSAIRRMRSEWVVAFSNTAADVTSHTVPSDTAATFTWDYEQGARPALAKLYEKAKVSMWNASDLPWEIEVDPERVAAGTFDEIDDTDALVGTRCASWGPEQRLAFKVEKQRWELSQFLHGEQGALLCTARLVEAVPWVDAKYYAATQVVDEARHTEVFSRYLDTKIGGHYPVNLHLQALLDDILRDSRWDLAYLGMQVMVEGLALASFGFIRQHTTEPLLDELMRLVMRDEARHVAFGLLSLKDHYQHLSAAEIRDRQEFVFDAAVRMRERFRYQEVWEHFGISARDALKMMPESPRQRAYEAKLFSKIIPNLAKLGLLDAGDGWLRKSFTELGVIGFEDVDEADGIAETLAGAEVDAPRAPIAEAR